MQRRKKLQRVLAITTVIGLCCLLGGTQLVLAQEGPGGGVLNRDGTQNGVIGAAPAPAQIVYNLYATDGYVTLADGNPTYIYGFVGGRAGAVGGLNYLDSTGVLHNIPGGAPSPTGGPVAAAEQQLAGNAQFPAPLIYATVGDVVEIRLKNLGTTSQYAPNDPHSIHLHGLDVDAANDGVPETSVAAVPANLTVPGAGNVVVYMFSPKYAGTYMYHCHQEADIHVQMGMYGALVVYNKGDAAAVNGPGTGTGTLFNWKYDKDYVLLMSEMDLGQHVSEETANSEHPVDFNPVDYKPQYWFLNGLSFPDTIHANPNWTNWIAAHPGYDPLIVGSVAAKSFAGGAGQKVLIRMINMGFETQPMHMHGFHGKVLGSDQRAWPWAQPAGPNSGWGQGLEKQTLNIGSGETYEWLINFGLQASTSTYPSGAGGINGTFTGGTQTKYNDGPLSNTDPTKSVIPDLNGVPYIGGPVVTGAQGLLAAGQLFPFHNHDDYKATNNGAYPGGMFTMIAPQP